MEGTNVFNNSLCAYCFDVIIAELKHLPTPEFPKNIPDEKFALFVTWTFFFNGSLRGCIGTFSPDFLSVNLPKYAKISAFEDRRFGKIKMEEISKLMCEVSLLHNFENISNIEDWEIGVHGIELKFESNGKLYSSTYLPEVAKKYGWTKKQTIESLLEKAGYFGDLKSV